MAVTNHIYEVEFLPVGKLHLFTWKGTLSKGDMVLGTSDFGLEVGTVVRGPLEQASNGSVKPLVRKMSQEDIDTHHKNEIDAQEAFGICREKIATYKLPMKLLKAVYMFDRSKILFYFSAENRVDFRELVRDLARTFKMRIELRQVGVRDELKFTGACGMCGQVVCCKRFLREFDTITLKDAKKQQLLINPIKISGQCKRLLCCLRYEVDAYAHLMKGIPGQGAIVEFEGAICKVISANVFSQEVNAISDSGKITTIPFSFFNANQIKIIKDIEDSDSLEVDIPAEDGEEILLEDNE